MRKHLFIFCLVGQIKTGLSINNNLLYFLINKFFYGLDYYYLADDEAAQINNIMKFARIYYHFSYINRVRVRIFL